MTFASIAVYGAGGHTGKFVVRELQRRGYPVVSIGRALPPAGDKRRDSAEWRVASCDDPDALDAALRGTSAVINCAGPFLDTAPALIEAALRSGIQYLDITAEQRSARQSLATYNDEARERGTVVLPAMAFYGGLADLLAADVADRIGAVESIEIGVALDCWHPTEGTRTTGDRNTARRLVVINGRLSPMPRSSQGRDWMFPEPFGRQEVVPVPMSEIVTIHHHIAAQSVCSYMNLTPLRDLEDSRTPAPKAMDSSGQSSQRFVMNVLAASGEVEGQITASGGDIYAITAPIVVEACSRVLHDPPTAGGAYAPAELFDTETFLSALAPQLVITRSPDIPLRERKISWRL